jgi:hypothetical protein
VLATTPTTQADRIQRSLKRLGFRLYRTGRTFRIMDTAGELAVDSKPGMSLAEIEAWIGAHMAVSKDPFCGRSAQQFSR